MRTSAGSVNLAFAGFAPSGYIRLSEATLDEFIIKCVVGIREFCEPVDDGWMLLLLDPLCVDRVSII